MNTEEKDAIFISILTGAILIVVAVLVALIIEVAKNGAYCLVIQSIVAIGLENANTTRGIK